MVEAQEQPHAAALVVDALSFRRAGLAAILVPWAEANGLELVAAAPEQAAAAPHAVRIAIANLGSGKIGDPGPAAVVAALRGSHPDARLAVISDREEAEEVMAAFRAGAHGFIPTSTEPPVALQALSFVLAGGSFFPPAVLLNEGAGAPRSAPNRESHRRQDNARSGGADAGLLGAEARRPGVTARIRRLLRRRRAEAAKAGWEASWPARTPAPV